MVLSQSLGYLCSYMKFKFLFFLSAPKSKSLQLFLQKKEVECDIIGIRTAVLETETNSLYHYTNGIRLQVMFSFCIFIVCLVKVKKPLQKLCTNNLAQRRMQKRSWSVKKTFARTNQTTWNRVKLRYFDVCVWLNFFMTTQLITNLTPSTPKAFGYHPPTETTRLMLTSTLLNMTYSPLNPDASMTTCRKLNAELYVYLNKDMTLLSSQPTKARRLWLMVRKWYLDECYCQLNNPTFSQQQNTDLTARQKRVTEYAKRMLNDELIHKKNQTIPIT